MTGDWPTGRLRGAANTATEPSPADRALMVSYREDGPDHEERQTGYRPGGCSWMSEWVEDRFGWSQDGGCYLPGPHERHSGRHVAHLWNVLPDGRICDATADQFGAGGDGIRISAGDDPRYLPACDGELCNGGRGAD